MNMLKMLETFFNRDTTNTIQEGDLSRMPDMR